MLFTEIGETNKGQWDLNKKRNDEKTLTQCLILFIKPQFF